MRRGFPTSAAWIWASSFCRALRRELRGKVAQPGALVGEIRLAAIEGLQGDIEKISDDREKTMIASCWLVLSAYRVLHSHMSQPEVISLLRTVVSLVFQKPMRWLVRVWLLLVRRPLGMLSKNRWLRFSRLMYGPGLEFDQEEGNGRVDLIVNHCAFHQFFSDHDAPHLTQVFCLWDRNWMDGIDASGRGLSTERLTTLSTGGNCCRFRVVSTGEAKGVKNQDIVLREFGESDQ